MQIRKYQHSDRKSIIDLLRQNTPTYFAPSEESDLNDFLDNHLENYFVVEVENEVLACGGFNTSEDEKIIRISWDIVHPQFQGKGLGSKLIKFRIQKIKEIKNIEIIVVRTSQLVYQFYEKFGFELKEIVRNFWADGFDLYHMELQLDKNPPQ
ncbi:hypothetical protein EMA8858_01833 [Emticicia aquatica]|uniref:N-acetyltransferase domain-containing protein n=1 Tax=Emticicia aquatica TaxID=1681835 RepID=A0ABN8EV78_9BACT|nr:GNAT family N-acetyltransferase [Emticicia aquatica]CAH0995708.1 hypothetical protein EMA8858_01833 [Emticicia aquatica]